MNAVILAVILTVVQAGSPVPRTTANPQTGTAQNVKQNAETKQTPTNNAPASATINPIRANEIAPVAQTNTAKDVPQQDAQQSVRVVELPPVSVASSRLEYAGLFATLALVVAGFWGIKIAIRTVKAADKAAQAALLNAQAVIYTERPWLIVEDLGGNPRIFKPNFVTNDLPPTIIDDHADCAFYVKNYGRTPAVVVAQKSELQISYSRKTPLKSTFFENIEPIDPYVFPQDTARMELARLASNLTSTIKVQMDNDVTFLWLCGYIRYRDSVPQAKVVEYETRFCYVYHEGKGGNPVWITGPAQYNSASQHESQETT